MQDAHEFLNFVLNDMAETLERTEKDRRKRGLPASTFPLPPGCPPLPHKRSGPGSKLGRSSTTSQATLHNGFSHLNGRQLLFGQSQVRCVMILPPHPDSSDHCKTMQFCLTRIAKDTRDRGSRLLSSLYMNTHTHTHPPPPPLPPSLRVPFWQMLSMPSWSGWSASAFVCDSLCPQQSPQRVLMSNVHALSAGDGPGCACATQDGL